MRNCFVGILSLSISSLLSGCAGSPSIPLSPIDCALLSTTSLVNYDKLSSQFLDESTRHPTTNLGGQVVWNTRYYLESLITAYEATGNPKYLNAFQDTGKSVMGLVQTMQVLDVPDPSGPSQTATGPIINATGWPTYMATFGVPALIPTVGGAVALYVQSLDPADGTGPTTLQITQQSDGSLQFVWLVDEKTLQTTRVESLADLNTLASQPLVYGKSVYRIKPTGIGLPASGSYDLSTPLHTIWHAEQSGEILLPFTRFLLIANDHPTLVDPNLVADWQSKVLQIAANYTDEFFPDGQGGYVLENAIWMPSTSAGIPAESDYIYVEISSRMALFKLTNDPKQLALARGLLQRQLTRNVSTSSHGWLMLREWPDITSWSNRAEGPPGSIYDSFSFNSTTPESTDEGGPFVQMLDLANSFGLASGLDIQDSLVTSQSNTSLQYLQIPDAMGLGLKALMRADFPSEASSESDPPDPDDNVVISADYVPPALSDTKLAIANWDWMLARATSPQGLPIGYFLRAWARSESAALQTCKASKP